MGADMDLLNEYEVLMDESKAKVIYFTLMSPTVTHNFDEERLAFTIQVSTEAVMQIGYESRSIKVGAEQTISHELVMCNPVQVTQIIHEVYTSSMLPKMLRQVEDYLDDYRAEGYKIHYGYKV